MDNIFIHAPTGLVTIADFSMATDLSRKSQNEFLASPPGSLAYIAPEQIGRTSKVIDHRSDFYSLGVVFYEILTGQLPLHAGSHIQWAHAHMAKKPVCPEEVNPDIPPAISLIIMKLLAKSAGERYQSAAGLLADLGECHRQWSQTGIIQSFTPGRMDISGLFQLPRKLYGREKDTAVLTTAFQRVCSGQAGLLLVHGYAGTGKTVLINETLKPLVAERGYFITGKFDQLQWNIPYVPFIRAFGDLMRQLLTESRESLAVWKKRLLRALGRNGAVITKVIPEVELIIGSQLPVETLQLWETRNRFIMVFRNFIQAFAEKEHPLVIFLDDLQWADPASLELIRYLCEDAESRYLLLIGAYRENEVTGNHPLIGTLEELEDAQIPFQDLPLAPLDQDCTNQFVADTLHCTKERSQPLAEMLNRKTGGNPFFLGQVLLSAHEEDLLRFSPQDGRLEWDPVSIGNMPLTDDIINFMLGKLQKLPEETLKVLKMAACIGNMFDLKTLSFSSWKTPGQAVADLWPAIVEGLVLLVNAGSDKKTYRIADNYPVVDFMTKYEFLHDRVQQAAYSLFLEEEKKEAHLTIGRLILVFTAQDLLDEEIYIIMDHLNRGLDLIIDSEERIQLAEYNLLAGRKAKAATAYDAALNYYKCGMNLLPDNAWDKYYRLAFELYLERAYSEYLCTHHDSAEKLFDVLLSQAKTDMEKADIYIAKIVLNSTRERYHETVELGIEGLRMLGVNLPEMDFFKDVLLVKWRIRNWEAGDCADLPALTDPRQKKVMLLLLALAGAAYMVNPELYALIILKVSSLSFEIGNAEFSPIGYAGYSFISGSILGDYEKGHKFAETAMKMVEKSDNISILCIVYFVLGAFVSHWAEHGKTCVNYLEKAVDYGIESGNLPVVGYAANLLIENKYLLGYPLESLYKQCQSFHKLAKRLRLLNYQLLFSKLQGLASTPDNLMDGEKEERERIFCGGILQINKDDFRELIEGETNTIATYNFSQMQLHYLDGDYGSALAITEKAQQDLTAIRGLMLSAEYIFYYSLAITAGYEGLPAKEQKKYWKVLQGNQQQMKKWADVCQANFLHKYLLVAAEVARLAGQDSEAMSLYDQAIESAGENGFVQNEAIGSEAAARFYLAKGRKKIAQVYLIDACRGYKRWGATRKVRTLQEQYPHLLAWMLVEEETLATAAILKNALLCDNNCSFTGDMDLVAVRKAVMKLAEETNPDTIIKTFLEIAIENAGADKGYLVLEKGEKLLLEVAKESDMHIARVITPLPLEQSANLSRAMVQYVARTLEPVVLNDIEQAGIFARDPYILQSRSKSIVCLPLLFQHIPIGILYLENSLMAGVFTSERLELLKFLLTQMAYVKKLQSFLEDGIVGPDDEMSPPAPLTEREVEVLNLIAAGMSNKEIAQGLELTISTVKTHILNIYGKLGVSRRVQAVSKAKKLKLLNNRF